MTPEERKAHRIKLWYENKEEHFMGLFTPRIKSILSKQKRKEMEMKSTYYFGCVGGGKTVQACSDMLDHIYTQYINKGATIAHYEFIQMGDLLLRMRNTFNKSESQITAQSILDKYIEVPFLVIDDLGTEKLTDWVYENIYYLINERYEFQRPIIITSNFDLNALTERLSDSGRIASRLLEMCELVEITGENKRYKK